MCGPAEDLEAYQKLKGYDFVFQKDVWIEYITKDRPHTGKQNFVASVKTIKRNWDHDFRKRDSKVCQILEKR